MADAEAPVTVLLILCEEERFGGKVKELKDESPDLTNDFPEGTSSIKLKESAKKWQVFTRVNYHGATVTLEPGRCYNTLTEMGLDDPVQSIQRFPSYRDVFMEKSKNDANATS